MPDLTFERTPIEALPKTRHEYAEILGRLDALKDTPEKWRSMMRRFCTDDLFFLLRYVLRRPDMEEDWLFDRCREVQAEPDDVLNLWARDHRKSTIITFGLSIQEVLYDPEQTICILSNTRPLAKSFLRLIKRELEENKLLKTLFPDILWEKASKEAPKWSEDDGLIVRRKTNPSESTFEAWGMVDGSPIGKHFTILVYDDMVTPASVGSPEMIQKTTQAWELSRALGRTVSGYRSRYAGTRYHFNDTYGELIKRDVAKIKIHAATEDATIDGEPVLLSREALEDKRKEMGPYVFSCQMLLNPIADSMQNFQYEWINFMLKPVEADSTGGMNVYLVVDPASDKKRKMNDWTSMFVVGLGADGNYRWLEMRRDRYNLAERTKNFMELHKKWRPTKVGYEEYGMQADIAHIKSEQDRLNYHFEITPLGGKLAKNDRIRGLIPVFEQGRFWFPPTQYYTNYEGKTLDMVDTFINEEYKPFPVANHDDMIDDMARILDPELNAQFPKESMTAEGRIKKKRYAVDHVGGRSRTKSWMGR
jgi:phage terminase large subunit-like protein